jgi:hypothetical protein
MRGHQEYAAGHFTLLPAAAAAAAACSTRLGHNTAHFNVGNYRRLQKDPNEVQDATFFDSHNKV